MDAVIALGIVALVALTALATYMLGLMLPPLPRWQHGERPYSCARCKVDYSDARALAWHQQGQHQETYE